MPIQLTPAQLEKQAARKAAKIAGAADLAASGHTAQPIKQKLSPEEIERRKFLQRSWIPLHRPADSSRLGDRRAKIVTWNLLAQTLVRRELFPGSDCLKWGERKHMLLAELEYYSNADIVCFQECDRLSDLSKALPQHSQVEAKGHGKLHGLVIMYRSARYRVKASKTIYLDEEYLHLLPSGSTRCTLVDEEPSLEEKRRRRGGSRCTKNIGLVVALEDVEKDKGGIIISTAHLFWHPKYAYERVRQSLIILRNVLAFKADHGQPDWPAIISGDFNTQPDEATYQIIADPHRPIPSEILKTIDDSRFVHHTVSKVEEQILSLSASPSASGTGTNIPAVQEKDEDEDREEQEPEGSVPGTRQPRAEDGIATAEELVSMVKQILIQDRRGCQSAYTSGQWGDKENTFSGRDGFKRSFQGPEPEGLAGGGEPAFTCYTPLFKLSLDYLFMLPGSGVTVTEVLRPGSAKELGEGLPRKGICASDHTAVGCEIAW